MREKVVFRPVRTQHVHYFLLRSTIHKEGQENRFSPILASDRVRAARCAFSHIKLEKRALFSGQMREFRIYYF